MLSIRSNMSNTLEKLVLLVKTRGEIKTTSSVQLLVTARTRPSAKLAGVRCPSVKSVPAIDIVG